MSKHAEHSDVVIIGGGIIGCAIAYYATQVGLTVTIIERNKVGNAASRVAAGLLAPSGQIKEAGPFATLAIESMRELLTLQEEVFMKQSIDIGFNMCGALWLARDETEARELKQTLSVQQSLGYNKEWIEPQTAIYLEPTISHDILGAAYSPQEGQVNAQKLTLAFAKLATAKKAKVIHESAKHFLREGNKIIGVKTERSSIYGAQTIVANGAWSGLLAEDLGISIPVYPMKAQLASIKNVATMPSHVVFGNTIYIAPKEDETCLIGAVSEDSGFDKQTTIEAAIELLSQCVQIMPNAMYASLVGMKAGLRPRTPDKLPIIGNITGLEGMIVATGHNANGVLFSSITGKLIVTLIISSTPSFNIVPFSANRFNLVN